MVSSVIGIPLALLVIKVIKDADAEILLVEFSKNQEYDMQKRDDLCFCV